MKFFQKNLSGIPSECQTVWIQIRPDILSGLIWVQTVCKGYKQATEVATSVERVNKYSKWQCLCLVTKALNYNIFSDFRTDFFFFFFIKFSQNACFIKLNNLMHTLHLQ